MQKLSLFNSVSWYSFLTMERFLEGGLASAEGSEGSSGGVKPSDEVRIHGSLGPESFYEKETKRKISIKNLDAATRATKCNNCWKVPLCCICTRALELRSGPIGEKVARAKATTRFRYLVYMSREEWRCGGKHIACFRRHFLKLMLMNRSSFYIKEIAESSCRFFSRMILKFLFMAFGRTKKDCVLMSMLATYPPRVSSFQERKCTPSPNLSMSGRLPSRHPTTCKCHL